MPCACRQPVETYPDSANWGPLLWTAFHALAERSGAAVIPLYADDERRGWAHIFKLTAEIIPCQACREHYKEYLLEHPVITVATMPYAGLREWLRTWFWEFHESVNARLGKPSFSKADLTATYSAVVPRTNLRALEQPIMKAIQMSGIPLRPWIEWKNKYLGILSVLGV
jgi:hypothetical protein